MGDSSTLARLTGIGIGAGSNRSKVAALDGSHELTDQTPLLGPEMFEELQSDMAKISEESKAGMDEIRLQIANTQQNMENMAKNSEDTRESIAGIQKSMAQNSGDTRESIADIQQSIAKNSEESKESKAEMIEMRQLIESLSRESSSSHDAFLKDVL